MILRPHHLLCTQSYEGKGYSKEFIANMDEKVELLRYRKDFKIILKSTLDDLCVFCPSNKGDYCETENKVRFMDEKVLKYFNLKEDVYIYKDVIKNINKKITENILDDICSKCEWYKYDICRNIILKKSK